MGEVMRRCVLLACIATVLLSAHGTEAEAEARGYGRRDGHKSVPFWSHPGFDPEITASALPPNPEAMAAHAPQASLLETFNTGMRLNSKGFAGERHVAEERAKRQESLLQLSEDKDDTDVDSPFGRAREGSGSVSGAFKFRELHMGVQGRRRGRMSRGHHRGFNLRGAPPPEHSDYSAKMRFRQHQNSLRPPPSGPSRQAHGPLSYASSPEEMPFRRYARQRSSQRRRRRYEGQAAAQQAAPSFAEMQEKVVRAALQAKTNPRAAVEGPFGGSLDYGSGHTVNRGRIAVPTSQRISGATGRFDAPAFNEVYEQITSIVKNPHPDPSKADHHNPLFAHSLVSAPSRAPPPPPPPPPGPVMFTPPTAAPLPSRGVSLLQEKASVHAHNAHTGHSDSHNKNKNTNKSQQKKGAQQKDTASSRTSADAYIRSLASNGGARVNSKGPALLQTASTATQRQTNTVQAVNQAALPSNNANGLLQQLSGLLSQLQQPALQQQPQPLFAAPVPALAPAGWGLQPSELLELRSMLHAYRTGAAAVPVPAPVPVPVPAFAAPRAAPMQAQQLRGLLSQLQSVLAQRSANNAAAVPLPQTATPRFEQVPAAATATATATARNAMPPVVMPADQSAALVPLRQIHG